jgi:hypothetical protein
VFFEADLDPQTGQETVGLPALAFPNMPRKVGRGRDAAELLNRLLSVETDGEKPFDRPDPRRHLPFADRIPAPAEKGDIDLGAHPAKKGKKDPFQVMVWRAQGNMGSSDQLNRRGLWGEKKGEKNGLKDQRNRARASPAFGDVEPVVASPKLAGVKGDLLRTDPIARQGSVADRGGGPKSGEVLYSKAGVSTEPANPSDPNGLLEQDRQRDGGPKDLSSSLPN